MDTWEPRICKAEASAKQHLSNNECYLYLNNRVGSENNNRSNEALFLTCKSALFKARLCHFTAIRVTSADKKRCIVRQSWSSLKYNLNRNKKKMLESYFKWNISVGNTQLVTWKVRGHNRGNWLKERRAFAVALADRFGFPLSPSTAAWITHPRS